MRPLGARSFSAGGVDGRPGRMRRIAVVGSGGAGKSTFARELGRRLGLAVIHLDEHHWRPGWVETPKAEWRQLQGELIAGESWIVDGNYGGTLDVRLSRADTVIILALPRVVCTLRALWRALSNHGREVQAPGCPERLQLEFVRWVWRYPIDSRPRLDQAISAFGSHLEVIELRSRREVRSFLEGVDRERS